MSQLRPTAVLALGTVALVLLAKSAGAATTKLAVPGQAVAYVDTIAPVMVSDSPVRPRLLAAPLAQATGNLLSLEQRAKLTRLPIPIVAPTALPAGFRLLRAEGEANKYANGDDDSGYAIVYEGEGNTCLSVVSSQDGPRRLPKVKQVQTSLGLMTVYMEKYRDLKSLVTFLGLKGNPVLISGGTLPDSTAEGGFRRCRAVSIETYTQVLKSLAIVK